MLADKGVPPEQRLSRARALLVLGQIFLSTPAAPPLEEFTLHVDWAAGGGLGRGLGFTLRAAPSGAAVVSAVSPWR